MDDNKISNDQEIFEVCVMESFGPLVKSLSENCLLASQKVVWQLQKVGYHVSRNLFFFQYIVVYTNICINRTDLTTPFLLPYFALCMALFEVIRRQR